jgi:hypothetical protein
MHATVGVVFQMLAGEEYNRRYPLIAMPDLLDTAKANLRTTVFFGITEYWNTTLCLFHKELNGPGPRASEFANIRPTSNKVPASLSSEDKEQLRAAVQFDTVLYDEALQDFTRRAAAFNCPMQL